MNKELWDNIWYFQVTPDLNLDSLEIHESYWNKTLSWIGWMLSFELEKLLKNREGLFFRIKEWEPIIASIRNINKELRIHLYTKAQNQKLADVVEIRESLWWTLAAYWINDDKILDSIKMFLTTPHFDWTTPHFDWTKTKDQVDSTLEQKS